MLLTNENHSDNNHLVNINLNGIKFNIHKNILMFLFILILCIIFVIIFSMFQNNSINKLNKYMYMHPNYSMPMNWA